MTTEDYTQAATRRARDLEDEAGGSWDHDEYATYEDLSDAYFDGVLDIRFEADWTDKRIVVRTVTLVLGTGGPHVEVRVNPDSYRHTVVMYGWFGAGRAEVDCDLAGHPLADYADLIRQTIEGDQT